MRLAILGSVLAAAAIAIAAPAAAEPPAAVTLLPGEVLLEVSGTGTVQSRADRVLVTAMARGEGPTFAKAREAGEAQVARLVAAARAEGIAEAEIRTGGEPAGFVGNEAPIAWSAYAPKPSGEEVVISTVEIRLADDRRFPALRRALEAAGSTQVTGPAYSLGDDRAARAEAKAKAVADARVQAEIYARATNLRLGRLLRISERAASPMEDALAMQEMLRSMTGQGSRPPGMVETRVRLAVDYSLVPSR